MMATLRKWLPAVEHQAAGDELSSCFIDDSVSKQSRLDVRESQVRRQDMKDLEERLRREFVSSDALRQRLASIRAHVARSEEVTKLDVTARLVSSSIELERLRKMVEVTPSAREMEAIKETGSRKLNAFKVLISERFESTERAVRIEVKEESLRLEALLRDLEVRTHEFIGPLEARLKSLGDELQHCVDETLRTTKILEGKISDLKAKNNAEMNEIRSKLNERSTRQEEARTLALSLEKTQHELTLRVSEIQTLISRHEEKAESVATDFSQEIHTMNERIEASKSECESARNETRQLDEQVAKLVTTQEAAERRMEAGEQRVEDVATHFSRVETALDRLVEDDFVAIRKLTEETSAEAKKSIAKLDDTVGDHATQLKLFTGRLKKAEQELFRAVPPKLSEHAEKLADFCATLQDHMQSQAEWNAQTAACVSSIEATEEADIRNLRHIQDTHLRDIGALQAEMLKSSECAERDRKHIVSIESTVARNHEALRESVETYKQDADTRFDHQKTEMSQELASLRSNMKRMFLSLEEDVSTKMKYTHNSPIHLGSEDQKVFLRNQAVALSGVALDFEQLAHERCNVLLNLPRDSCKTISLVTQKMAEYITLKADVWAVENQIHGASDNIQYGDDAIETRRQRLLNNFVELFTEEVTRRSPEPGGIKLEARAKFRRKVRNAFDIAFTKFDRVTVTSASRFLSRRLSTPKCVTCDRPLALRQNHRIRACDDSWLPPGRPESAAPQLQSAASHDFRPTSSEYRSFGTASNSSNAGSATAKKVIMRAGFRLPRGQLSPDLQRMLEPNIVAARREAYLETDPVVRNASIASTSSLPTFVES